MPRTPNRADNKQGGTPPRARRGHGHRRAADPHPGRHTGQRGAPGRPTGTARVRGPQTGPARPSHHHDTAAARGGDTQQGRGTRTHTEHGDTVTRHAPQRTGPAEGQPTPGTRPTTRAGGGRTTEPDRWEGSVCQPSTAWRNRWDALGRAHRTREPLGRGTHTTASDPKLRANTVRHDCHPIEHPTSVPAQAPGQPHASCRTQQHSNQRPARACPSGGGPSQPSGRSRAAPDRQGKQGARAEGTGGAVRVSGARAQPERDAKSRGEGGRRRGEEGGPPRP